MSPPDDYLTSNLLDSPALDRSGSVLSGWFSTESGPLRLRLGLGIVTIALLALASGLLSLLTSGFDPEFQSAFRWLQGLLLGLTFAASVYTLRLVHRRLILPLRELLQAAQAARVGGFAIRIRSSNPDEIGELGMAFNTMLDRLTGLYEELEQRVDEKTRELQQSNHCLQLLYRNACRLAEKDLTQDTLLELLVDVENELGLGPGILCVRRDEDGRAYPLATPIPEAERAELCESLGCNICFGDGVPQGITQHQVGDIRLVSVPLTGNGQWQGVMPFQLKSQQSLAPWQSQVLETLAGHVATALANARRAEERHRLAVHEERAVIARELHDSIAQSLSYLKIQIALLQSRLQDPATPGIRETVDELKTGLGAAYRELRELLTTFRLTPGQTPFTEELAALVAESSRRCGFEIELEQRMNNLELSAEEEIHLNRLIREALANVQHHAQATWARVRLSADSLRQVELEIEDDGVGFQDHDDGQDHFGLQIMRERAHLLGAQLHFTPRPEGGIRLALSFIARTAYAHRPPGPMVNRGTSV